MDQDTDQGDQALIPQPETRSTGYRWPKGVSGNPAGRTPRGVQLANAHKRAMAAAALAEEQANAWVSELRNRLTILDLATAEVLADWETGKVKGIALAQQINALRGLMTDAAAMLGQMPKGEKQESGDKVTVIVRNRPGLGIGGTDIGVQVERGGVKFELEQGEDEEGQEG